MHFCTSFTFILCVWTFGWSQDCQSTFQPKKELAAQTYLCAEAMQADLDQLHKHILETHPNPTYYCTLNDLSLAYNLAKNKLQNPLSVFNFMLVINSYLVSLKDSHTGINPRQFLYNINAKRKVLPFNVQNIDDKFYVSNAYNPDFIVGAELLQIDSFSIQQLYQHALNLSLTEGDAIEATKEIATQNIGIAYNLLSMSLKETKNAYVKMVAPAGDTVLQTIAFTSYWKYLLSGMFETQTDEIRSSFDQNNNAILVIESFQPISLAVYKKKIDAFFQQVETSNCKSVYIDLRNNQGGLLRAQEYLFSYINTPQTPLRTNYLYKRSNYDRFAQLSPMQQMQFENRAKNVYPNGLISQEYDFYKLPKGAIHTILYDYLPENNRNYVYKGNCTLVLNGNSMSAAVLFAAWFKHIDRGVVIGAQCMGGMGGTFGNPALISLKNSGLGAIVSTLKFTPLHVQKPILDPIQPELKIKATKEDLIKKRDPFEVYLQNHHKR